LASYISNFGILELLLDLSDEVVTLLIMTMRKTLLTAVALVVAVATRIVASEKDNNYYPPGYSNPNESKAILVANGLDSEQVG
jgi:hypothetical protein